MTTHHTSAPTGHEHPERPRLPITSAYTAKDQGKWDRCTRMIGRGSARSSTHRYAQALGHLANCGHYTADDTVFVSSEGARTGRIGPDWHELARAIAAGARFVTDTLNDRERPYNCGERDTARFLAANGYRDDGTGLWSRQE